MQRTVGRVIDALHGAEAAVAVAAFACITAALFADLVGRELFGKGIFIAQRFAVYCMIVAAMLGFALAVGWRAHIGIEIADKLAPKRWDAVMERIADGVAAAGCLFLAYWAWRFVAGSFADQARGQGLEIVLWPVQAILVWSFATSALRHAAYAAWPDLRSAHAEQGATVVESPAA